MKINPLGVTFEPLVGSTFTNLLRLIAQKKQKMEMFWLYYFNVLNVKSSMSISLCLTSTP